MILLANISTLLEIANGNQLQLKNLENFQVCQQLDISMFSKLFWEIGLRGWCSVIARFGSLICHLEHGEDGLAPEATV